MAEKTGLHVGTIFQKRQKLGIPASRPAKTLKWNPAMLAMLGKLPDRELADLWDMNFLSVYKKRVSKGISCYARKSKSWHFWTKKEIALLGKMSDDDVVLRTGIKKASVAWKRRKLAIPPFHKKRPKKHLKDWTRKQTALLGKMTDAAAANALDFAHSAVRRKRLSLGIPAFGRKKSQQTP